MPDPSRLFAALEREREERKQEDQHYSRSRGEQLHEAEVAAATATVEAAVETQAPVAVAAAAPAAAAAAAAAAADNPPAETRHLQTAAGNKIPQCWRTEETYVPEVSGVIAPFGCETGMVVYGASSLCPITAKTPTPELRTWR